MCKDMETFFGDWFDLPDWVRHEHLWWVLSDTHGRARELRHLLHLAPDDARVMHLGDIGDRGPASLECFEILDQTDAVLIAGNHDLFIAPALQGDVDINTLWDMNGGRDFQIEIELSPDYTPGKIPTLIQRVLDRQSNYALDGNLVFLHGGVDPAQAVIPFLESPPPTVRQYYHESIYPSHPAWIRFEFLGLDGTEPWIGMEYKPFFIHGHTRLSEDSMFPRRTNWRLGVDWLDGMSALEIRCGKARFIDIYENKYAI